MRLVAFRKRLLRQNVVRKEKCMEKLKQKLLSVILAVAMVISGITVPEKTAKAATSSQQIDVYFKYTGPEAGWAMSLR